MVMVNERGPRLLLAFNSLLRTVLIHNDLNQQSIDCAGNFIAAVSAACGKDAEELILQSSNGRFFLGDEKILHGKNTAAIIQVMLDYLEKRRLSGFTFFPDINKASLINVLAFARLVNQAIEQEDPVAWLKKTLQQRDFSWVEVFEPTQEAVDSETACEETDSAAGETRRDRARKAYSCGLANLKEVARKLGSGQRTGINKSVRLVQNLVNLLHEDEAILLGLSTLKIYDDDTYSHSVNVALLSMCIGKRIGLTRGALEKLGLCGLFHDLGKISIPPAITKKPNKLTDQERLIMQTHTMHSVRQIMMFRAPHNRKAQLVLPAFEHHMKFDLSGYPKAANWRPGLFGKIISIADVFDAISSPRVYRKTSLSPDRAISIMIDMAGKDFDPILLKVFINMLGFYPPGTLVELDSNQIGLVVDTPAENRASGMPRVLLLTPDGNSGYRKGKTINLANPAADSGATPPKIVKTAHPAAYNIQPAQYLF
jgi:HD-GYP domain-containing protein (c-di-GMP phosphodiesterase class II)